MILDKVLSEKYWESEVGEIIKPITDCGFRG
jgi:hypothetical protein